MRFLGSLFQGELNAVVLLRPLSLCLVDLCFQTCANMINICEKYDVHASTAKSESPLLNYVLILVPFKHSILLL